METKTQQRKKKKKNRKEGSNGKFISNNMKIEIQTQWIRSKTE